MTRSHASPVMLVASYNILAPELAALYWQSDGLPLPADEVAFSAATAARISCVIEVIRSSGADVVALQEISLTPLACLGGATTASFICKAIGYELASTCMKDSVFEYPAYPGGPPCRQASTGVATLYNSSTVVHAAHLGAATRVYARQEDDGSSGDCALNSPHVVDEFTLIHHSACAIIVVNTHLKMLPYPHVGPQFRELLARLDHPTVSARVTECADRSACARGSECASRHGSLSREQWGRTVIIGDFNCLHPVAATELEAALVGLNPPLVDATPFIAHAQAQLTHVQDAALRPRMCRYGTGCHARTCVYVHPRANDRVLIGERIAARNAAILGADRCMRNADKRRRRQDGDAVNASLLASGRLASDHCLLRIEVNVFD